MLFARDYKKLLFSLPNFETLSEQLFDLPAFDL